MHHIYWELSLFSSCPIHNCLLIDECNNCGRPINTIKINILKCECGFNFRNSPITRVQGEFSKYLEERLERKNLRSFEITDRLPLDKLYFLFLFTVRWAKVNIGGKMHNYYTQPLKSGMLYEACETALEIYDKWPCNFYSLIDDIRITFRRTNKSSKGDLLRKLFHNFEEYDEFGFISDAVDDYSNSYWVSGYKPTTESIFSPKIKQRKKLD